MQSDEQQFCEELEIRIKASQVTWPSAPCSLCKSPLVRTLWARSTTCASSTMVDSGKKSKAVQDKRGSSKGQSGKKKS